MTQWGPHTSLANPASKMYLANIRKWEAVTMDLTKRDQREDQLRTNLQQKHEELKLLLAKVSDHWTYEDNVYRFYHQSFKVFRLCQITSGIVAKLAELLPDQPLNEWFVEIIKDGTGREFDQEDNSQWLEATRPILEAYFHARFFLEMAVKYGDPPPKDQPLPSGWAGLLYLFNIR